MIFFKLLMLIESLNSAVAWIPDARNAGASFSLKEMSAENNI